MLVHISDIAAWVAMVCAGSGIVWFCVSLIRKPRERPSVNLKRLLLTGLGLMLLSVSVESALLDLELLGVRLLNWIPVNEAGSLFMFHFSLVTLSVAFILVAANVTGIFGDVISSVYDGLNERLQRWWQYRNREKCGGCLPRKYTPCKPAEYLFLELLKRDIFYDRRRWEVWRGQCPALLEGIVHIVCQKHPEVCVNCGLNSGVRWWEDPIKVLMIQRWPVPPEDCYKLHYQQWAANRKLRVPLRRCPVCMEIPPYSAWAIDQIESEYKDLERDLQSWYQDSRPTMLPEEVCSETSIDRF